MRVALLSAEYPPQPGGVGDYTWRLGQALAQRGHAITALTSRAMGPAGAGTIEDPPTFDLQISSWDWRCWRAVIAALDRLRPDVLHIQYQTGAYAMHPAINLLPWRLRHLPGRPAIAVTAHDLLLPYLFPKAGPLRRWVTRRLLADADAAVVTNEQDFAQLHRGQGSGRQGDPLRGRGKETRRQGDRRSKIEDRRSRIDDLLSSILHPQSSILSPPSSVLHPQSSILSPPSSVLIPIGSNIPVAPPERYDRAAWRTRLGVAADEALIAHFGLISRSKGLDVLLDALAQLPGRFRLLVIGGEATAPEDRAFAAQLRGRIDRADLHGRVIVTGHCGAAEVSAGLLAADLAALPFADGASFRRGSLLAALAHGVPTVTTRSLQQGSGIRGQGSGTIRRSDALCEQYTGSTFLLSTPGSWNHAVASLVDGENVLLTPPGDSAALAAALRRLAADATLRERLRAGSRELAARFSWEEIAARHEALYRAIVWR